MAAVASYQVLHDSSKAIEYEIVGLSAVPVPVEFSLLLPPNLITESNRARPVFQCRMTPLDRSGTSTYFEWSATINGASVFSARHSSRSADLNNVVAFWEVFEWAPVLASGATLGSSVTLSLTARLSSVRLTDIIVWYQVEV